MKRICLCCNVQYLIKQNTQKFCSKKCKRKIMKQRIYKDQIDRRILKLGGYDKYKLYNRMLNWEARHNNIESRLQKRG